MLCGVTATLGSNPSATATAARPHRGRAVLLCLDGVGACACVLVVPRVFLALLVCLGRAAWCARGRRPAREPSVPRAFGSARRLEARPGPAGLAAASNRSGCLCVVRPGPATAHRHRGRSLRRPPHQWCQVADVARCIGLLFGQAPPPPVGVTGVSRVEFLGWSGACCYKRRQSDGFLAENGRYRSVRAMTSRKSRM